MVDEQKPEEPKPSPQPDTEPEEEKTSSDLIRKANEAAARLEAANIEHSKLISRQEKLAVENMLGGQAAVQTVPKEETPQEYKDKVMRGDFNDQTA